jgi:N-acetyl-anhydromuramyl-L-alanine amidase AmpD
MHNSKLAGREDKFKETGVAVGRSFKLTKFELPIKGEDLKLHGYTVRPSDGFEGYFYSQKYKKKKIVLHFTVGHLQGDIHSLTSPTRGHVSTAFVLGRDGTTYQLFSSTAWSYHLGRGAIGGNGTNSKETIGIEISNYGPLVKRGNNLETVYSKREGHDVYCSLEDTDKYVKLDKPYRGHQYFTTFTDEQYENLIVLLRYLTASYDIPRKFIDEDTRYKATTANAQFKGIQSHVNYRKDKVDIGPAFDWNRVIAGVTSDVYNSNPLEKKVAEIEAKIAKAKEELKVLQGELLDAQGALDAAAANSRGLGSNISNEEDLANSLIVHPTGYNKEDGYLSEEMDKSSFYLDDVA